MLLPGALAPPAGEVLCQSRLNERGQQVHSRKGEA